MPKEKIRRLHASSRKNRAQQIKILEYDITYDPIQDKNYNKLPDHIKDQIDKFYYLVQKNPDPATIFDLENLIEKFPNIPMLYNYLSIAYSRLKNREKFLEIVERNFRMNPDYLFARLNYAEVCIQRGDYGKISEIFDHKFDLQLLYPKREKFHISEVANFMGIMGIYFFKMGKKEIAENHYKILAEIADDYPITKKLHKQLHPGFLKRLIKSMIGNN